MIFSKLKSLVLCICLISIANALPAQEKVPGMIIFNNMDTLKGTIKKRSARFDKPIYTKVRFWDKTGKKKTYTPNELKGFITDEDTFRTFQLVKLEPYKVFMRVVMRGHCTLYEHVVLNLSGSYSNTMSDYYLKRKGEQLHFFDWDNLVKGKDNYFIDNGPLTFDIRNKKYKFNQVRIIVERYNREYEEKQKEGAD